MPDTLVKEIQETFAYDKSRWEKVREEARKDMRCVAGDPWDPTERRQREDAKRPCLSLDEIGQFSNQLINNVRQNKRAIKVSPRGSGANDQTAEVRQGIMRNVEYESNAQGAYITAFENAVNRSYGYWRLSVDWASDSSFDRKLAIRQIANPDAVWIDPDTKLPDRSDMKHAFILDVMARDEYERRYPKAKISDFSLEDTQAARDWVSEKTVQVGEYWKVTENPKTLLLVQPKQRNRLLQYIPALQQAAPSPIPVFEDDYKEWMGKIIDERIVLIPQPIKYITNGVEVIDQSDWPGRWIPLFSVFGKELWVDMGAGPERQLLSLVRLARDPLMLYCYYRTCEAELVGMTPKTAFIGYEGQFEGHEDEWQQVNLKPIPYLQVKPFIEGMVNPEPLPLPQRQPYEPPIQQLEIGAEAARRAIQSAMGIVPLPTAAQRMNEKSGIALDKIQDQENVGTFHFIDNLDMQLENCGRQMDDLIPFVYDTPRDVGLRKPDDSYAVMGINQPTQDPDTGKDVNHDMTVGEHAVTIAVGPSFQSQRERFDDFLQQLLQVPLIGQNPQIGLQVLARIIKSMDLGAQGDQIADLLDPEPGSPEQMKMQLAQAKQQLQQLQGQLGAASGELASKKIEAQNKMEVAQLKAFTDVQLAEIDKAVRIAVAEIMASKDRDKALGERLAAEMEMAAGHAHEVAMAQTAPPPEADTNNPGAGQGGSTPAAATPSPS